MTQFRPPYAQAAGASAAAFLLYLVTLAPTTWFWDTSEYIATAHILGLPHPPGNPLFVVVGRVWSLLLAPTGLDVAVRINLLAAVTSSLATGFFFLVAYRILTGWVDRAEGVWIQRMPSIGAWLGALLGSTAFTVWTQSNVNEKVYTLAVLGIAAVSWLALRWYDERDRPGSGLWLVLAVFLMVLGTTNQLMALLPAPALGLMILLEKPRVLLDRNLLIRAGLAAVLALSFNFFLPIRSAQQPIINEGEPVCETLVGAGVAIYTNGTFGCEALAANLKREQYLKPSIFHDPTVSLARPPEPRPIGLIAHQYLNYFQYFDWQWARGLATSELPGNRRLPVTLLFLGLGIWGLVVSWRAGRGPGVYMAVLAVTLTLALVFYLNFKYGYSLGPAEMDRAMKEVRERDYFFIASFHVWGFLAGMGLMAAWRWTAGGRRSGSGTGGPTGRPLALASPILIVAFIPLVFNWAWASRSGDHSARDWAYNILQSVEPYGVLFTNGDNDTFPLWYLQEVEGIRPDVTVIVVQYLYTQWYPRQLNYHTSPQGQRAFQPQDDLGVYPVPESPPEGSITRLTDAELNQLGSGVLPSDQVFPLGPVALEFTEGTFLGRGERIALAIIRDSLGERPIHFTSSGGLAEEIGLADRLVRQGVTMRLRLDDLADDPALVQASPQLWSDWVDLDVTLTLAEEHFRYRGLEEREIWADRATLNIPWHFYILYFQLSDVAETAGMDQTLVDALRERSRRFELTARGGTRAMIEE